MRVFRIYLTTAPGLGRLLRDEVKQLMGRPIKIVEEGEGGGDESGCTVEGVMEAEMWRLCTFSRLASGLRIRLGEVKSTPKFAVFDRHV